MFCNFSLPHPERDDHARADGERRRDQAHLHLHRRRPELIRHVCRVFLARLLTVGPSTIDPVRVQVPLPSGTDPRVIGAAVRALACDRLIHSVGRERSRRPAAHARQVDIWAVSDRQAALDWLATHPELAEPADLFAGA